MGRTVPIRAIVQLIAIVSFAGMPYTVLMPIFADRILHVGPQGLGLLMGATGVGALGGALLLASRTRLKGFIDLDTIVGRGLLRSPSPSSPPQAKCGCPA